LTKLDISNISIKKGEALQMVCATPRTSSSTTTRSRAKVMATTECRVASRRNKLDISTSSAIKSHPKKIELVL
jgi:hypothetical protein